MNYASEAFSAIIRPLTQRSNSRPSNEPSRNPPRRANSYSGYTQSSEPRPSDLEEDGFLVVGETQSERTTIRAQDFQGNIDQPPEYNQAQVSSCASYAFNLSYLYCEILFLNQQSEAFMCSVLLSLFVISHIHKKEGIFKPVCQSANQSQIL
ncbi:hypothetical protein FSP39_004582 [Pinctada imbricata]|uniref:Uncharacterized protein n=1 Tax=Pinctada imbricata TaxID=66713 RepID=A0AA88XQB2_PINIB|nr:hypothetical protein FSP39_004582 [Pinctada imbricata]